MNGDKAWREERRRQARLAFNAAIVTLALCILAGMVAGGFVMAGWVTQALGSGVVSLVTGGASAFSRWLYREANDRFDFGKR